MSVLREGQEARMANFTRRIVDRESYFGSRSTWLVVCVTAAFSYLVPKLIGTLTSNPQTVWPLWPGCAILVTGLLLVRISVWPPSVRCSISCDADALKSGRPVP